MRLLRLIAMTLALLTLPLSVVLADDYQPWQNPNNPNQPGDMQQLVKQLRQLIYKAEKAKAADPNFLKDLKGLADSYDNPWPVKVFFDDFRDGEYLNNPPWRVSAGNWRVTDQPMHGLQTYVQVQQQANAYGNNQDIAGILNSFLQPGGQSQTQQQNQYAGISTSVSIPNAFNLHFEFTAGQDNQRLDLGFYRANNNGGYFLTYTPTAQNGLTLSRVVPGQANQEIDNSAGPLNIGGDRAPHTIDWRRARDGRMTVAVDGKIMIDATDTNFHRSFDGFAIGNSGGWYIIRSVTISGAPPS